MVGSATAANKRKRVFKIYSREEIQAADGTRSLQGGDDKTDEAVPAVMSMSMTLSPSGSPTDASIETIITSAPTAMSMMTKCAFCHGVIMPDPEITLPSDQTCGSVKAIADGMDVTNNWCVQLQKAEEYCCPPVVETTTSATVTMPLSTTTEAAVVETETTTTATTTTTEAASVPAPTAPSQETLGAPSGAMIMETTLAAVAVVGAMMLV
eukprot:CAMPEP_0113400242 /NCGR_PEP_ID=MMETSP0013_2-20120614/16012_1 /TAXON_ID=2843 ORGANISM="Skeletonema costatum, Strain 1716" /NCGR_SAMPLE_ID=MMETSP0013_2 /ASSEMBLY_ACC=CAM_ASM_000158 /LENGTH=209 /DNA_ID=CAMNT_0000285285 /DNA_START=97 /DNA_END=726 /DNA_ORIENTATION=- /assembly_acc=CAM_ASM_000158